MTTLAYFAARLGKTVSYFLEEDAIVSPNQNLMIKARAAVLEKNFTSAAELLEDYRGPDETFDAEFSLLSRITALELAQDAIENGRKAHGAEILENLGNLQDGYCAGQLEIRRLLLLAKARPQLRREICEKLPSVDEYLLLHARDALDRGDFDRSEHLLEAAQDRECADWNFLRGELHLALRQFQMAAACYHKAEDTFPDRCAVRLEYCYRELQDFRQAYFYACRQRE
jgi:predicted negative regulator of RcsB-dependent stress response